MTVAGFNRRNLARMIFTLVLALAAAGMGAADARADAASPWASTQQGRVRLIAASGTTGDARHVVLGLQFEMKPHWKIYWRSPGDAGFPPSVDWTGSQNLASAALAWPAPKRFTVLGLTTLGYEDAVVLPIDAVLAEPGKPLHVESKVNYLTCDDICVPYEARLSLDLPAGPAQSTPYGHVIDRFAKRVPGDGAAAGLGVSHVAVRRARGTEQLVVTVASREPLEHPDLYVEGPRTLEFGAPRVEPLGDGKGATLVLPVQRVTDQAPSAVGAALTLTLVDGARALETKATPGLAPPGIRRRRSRLVRRPRARAARRLHPQLHALRAAGAVDQAAQRRRPWRRRAAPGAPPLPCLGRGDRDIVPGAGRRAHRAQERGRRHRLGHPVPAILVPRRARQHHQPVRRQYVGPFRVPPARRGFGCTGAARRRARPVPRDWAAIS